MGRPLTFFTRLFKRRLHIPATNLSFISDSQRHLWCDEKRNRKIIIYYLSRKMHSFLKLSINGKPILTFRMTSWENFFSYLILLCSDLMLKLSSIKCFTMYFKQIKNYSKSVSEQMMFVPFVRLNQELYTISSLPMSLLEAILERFWVLLVPFVKSIGSSFIAECYIWYHI